MGCYCLFPFLYNRAKNGVVYICDLTAIKDSRQDRHIILLPKFMISGLVNKYDNNPSDFVIRSNLRKQWSCMDMTVGL